MSFLVLYCDAMHVFGFGSRIYCSSGCANFAEFDYLCLVIWLGHMEGHKISPFPYEWLVKRFHDLKCGRPSEDLPTVSLL